MLFNENPDHKLMTTGGWKNGRNGAICTADWHLTPKVPRIRSVMTRDQWIAYQLKAVRTVLEYGVKTMNPILVAGDVFDTWRTIPHTTELLYALFELLDEFRGSVDLHTIPGQHDLPYHRTDLIQQSTYGLLQQRYPRWFGPGPDALAIHMDTQDNPPWSSKQAILDKLNKCPDAGEIDLVVDDMGELERVRWAWRMGRSYSVWSGGWGVRPSTIRKVMNWLASFLVSKMPLFDYVIMHRSDMMPPKRRDYAPPRNTLYAPPRHAIMEQSGPPDWDSDLDWVELVVTGDLHVTWGSDPKYRESYKNPNDIIVPARFNPGPLICQAKHQQGLNAYQVRKGKTCWYANLIPGMDEIESGHTLSQLYNTEVAYGDEPDSSKGDGSDVDWSEIGEAISQALNVHQDKISALLLDVVKKVNADLSEGATKLIQKLVRLHD